MSLLSEFLALTQDWRNVFPQQRTFLRAVRQALGSLVCLGRRCLTRIIWTNGGEQHNWSSDYLLHSRCQWEAQQLFRPILQEALKYCPQRLVGVAVDDTRLHKTGRSIPQAFYQRDPMSPPFHVNLTLGLRFLQASILLPLHRDAGVSTRAVPIRFEEVSRVKRPGKRATEQMKEEYRQATKLFNLPSASLPWPSNCGKSWIAPALPARSWSWPETAASAIALASPMLPNVAYCY
jgi:hypothetical protein